MGQYHLVANLDKKEFLHPHAMGDGLKLLEFGSSSDGTMTGLAILLACSNGRGGGDLHADNGTPEQQALADKIVGRWAGDRIAIIGDYAETDDFPGFLSGDAEHNPWQDRDGEPEHWTNISAAVREVMEIDTYIRQGIRAGHGSSAGRDPYAIPL